MQSDAVDIDPILLVFDLVLHVVVLLDLDNRQHRSLTNAAPRAAQGGVAVPGTGAAGRAERLRTSLLGRVVLSRHAVPAAVALAVGAISIHNHANGVDWGDDFALYVHQAEALVNGNPGEVIAQTRFSVDNSGWHNFSPFGYPWGWPLLISPLHLMFGREYAVFKLLEVAALSGFLVLFLMMVRKRTGLVAATLLTLVVGLSGSFTGATDSVLSDLPFLFFVGLGLWAIDRARTKGLLGLSPKDSVALGLLLAFTFNVRREGACLLLALAALHAAAVARAVRREGGRAALRTVDWRRSATPYATFLVAVAAFHVLLPTQFLPQPQGTALANIPDRLRYHQDILAEHIGLKEPGSPMALLGSGNAAGRALTLLLVLAAFGMVGRLLLRKYEDLHIAAYLCSISLIVLVSPHQEGRYLFTVTPFLLYFAYQAFPTAAALWTGRGVPNLHRAAWPALAGLAGLAGLNGAGLARDVDYHRDNHYTVDGPETAESQEMLRAVQDLTRGDDVILFFRARAMTLYTERRAIQGSDLNLLLPRSDWYVMARESTYSQTPLTSEQGAARGLTEEWSNSRWVIWRIPDPDALSPGTP